MRALLVAISVCVLMASVWGCKTRSDISAVRDDETGGAYNWIPGYENLSPAERVGREIWYKAASEGGRAHSYVLPQRYALSIDFHRVLRSDKRGERFDRWGLINDPECCTPGVNCSQKGIQTSLTLQDTFGFDYCKGDEKIISWLNKSPADKKSNPLKDPACNLPVSDAQGSRCDLGFGWSSGSLSYRRFPNPRFDKSKWPGWDVVTRKDESGLSRLQDGSIELPYHFAQSCGTCHISFDPVNPPKNVNEPDWEHIRGAVGSQYARISETLASGMPTNSLEWQTYSHTRPGIVDTSAITNDFVNNPGTMNEIINFDIRFTQNAFSEEVLRWRQVNSCPSGSDPDKCWCRKDRQGICWQWGKKVDKVPHVLKGGEDAIGADGAVQRVYLNIMATCVEQCLSNHLTDPRQLNPLARQFGQTPMEIGQCRRDCPGFRAIEDRKNDVIAFLASRRPTNLMNAKLKTGEQVAQDEEELMEFLEDQMRERYSDVDFDSVEEHGVETIFELGEKIYRDQCATCHSSRPANERGDFFAKNEKGVRLDWLGNDKRIPVDEVKTYRCRSLHKNHMEGHLFSQWGSDTQRSQPRVNLRDPSGGGRGYYRAISLLSLWAHAPFMHNNAMGPEICGRGSAGKELYRSPYQDGERACVEVDASTENRLEIYLQSMESLLMMKGASKNEKGETVQLRGERPKKMTVTYEDIELTLAHGIPAEFQRLAAGRGRAITHGLKFRIKKGVSVTLLGSFDHKAFVSDMLDVMADKRPTRMRRTLGEEGQMQRELQEHMRKTIADLRASPDGVVEADTERLNKYLDAYSNCTEEFDNGGHPVGPDLGTKLEKVALTAFMAMF